MDFWSGREDSELDYWLYLFNNISKLKEVPEILSELLSKM